MYYGIEISSLHLAVAGIKGGGGEPHRHISVHMPFTDERAERMLREEARQLPTDAPGLVAIDVTRTSIVLNAWESLLNRRLQPSQHTRVSGIVLFQNNIVSDDDGSWKIKTSGKLTLNQHAKFELPASVRSAISDALGLQPK